MLTSSLNSLKRNEPLYWRREFASVLYNGPVILDRYDQRPAEARFRLMTDQSQMTLSYWVLQVAGKPVL